MSGRPTVTVGIPVFNGERFLEAAVESILRQDLVDIEVVVADNGSDDRTEAICQAYAAREPRLSYHRSPVNRGATWNYNRLPPLARAPYFKWAAHDDLLAPTFLRSCVEALEASPDTVVAYPRTLLIDSRGQVTDDEFVDGLDLRDGSPLTRFRRYMHHVGEQHPVFGVMRTEALRGTGLIANCWGGDQVLLAELMLRGRIDEVPERLFLRRYHSGTSLVASRTPAEVARWHDPSWRGRTAMPRSRLTVEMLKVAAGAPIPAMTRARCAAAVLTDWLPHYGRVIGGEVKRTVRTRFDRTIPAPPGAAAP